LFYVVLIVLTNVPSECMQVQLVYTESQQQNKYSSTTKLEWNYFNCQSAVISLMCTYFLLGQWGKYCVRCVHALTVLN